jgi:hypothetical protein
VNNTFVQKIDDLTPAPPPDDSVTQAQVPELLLQLKGEMLEDLQAALRTAHQETLEQNRFFINDALAQHRSLIIEQEASLKKMFIHVIEARADLVQLVNRRMRGVGSESPLVGNPAQEIAPATSCTVEHPDIQVEQRSAVMAESGGTGDTGKPPEEPILNPSSVITSVTEVAAQPASLVESRAGVSRDRGSTWIVEAPDVMTTQSIDLRTIYNQDSVFHMIAQHRIFRNMSLVMIITNAIYVGIEADWNDATALNDSPWYFQLSEHSFCLFFFGEIVIRFGAFTNKLDCLSDKWFMLDFALVFMMVVETWILSVVFSSLSNPPNTSAVAGIGRMFRLLRLARISKLMQIIPELVTMVKGMIAALRAVHAALLILLLSCMSLP